MQFLCVFFIDMHRSVKRHTHLFQRESPSNNGNGADKTDGGGSDDDGSSEGSKDEEEEDKEEDEDDDEDENGGQGRPQQLNEDSSNCYIGLYISLNHFHAVVYLCTEKVQSWSMHNVISPGLKMYSLSTSWTGRICLMTWPFCVFSISCV